MKNNKTENLIAVGSLIGIFLLFGGFIFESASFCAALIVLAGIITVILLRNQKYISINWRSITTLLLCVTMVGNIVLPVYATELEPTTVQETQATGGVETIEYESEIDLLTFLRNELARCVEAYQLTPEMSDQDLANVYFSLDSEGAKAAWDHGNVLMAEAQKLGAEDADTLLTEENAILCLRFYSIMQQIINSVPSVANITGTANPHDGLSVSGGSTFSWAIDSQKITVTATPKTIQGSGCDPDTYEAQTDTITLTSSSDATFTVKYTVRGTGTVKLNGTEVSDEGTKTYNLQVEGTNKLEIIVTSGSNQNDSLSLTLEYTYVPAGSDVKISFQPVASIPYTVNGATTIDTQAETISGDPADGFTVTATNTNFVLISATLVDEAGNTSTVMAIDGKLSPTVSGSLTPFFAYDSDADGIAPFLVGDNKYWDWDEAMTAAASGDKLVILNDDHTLTSGDYTVSSGVTLLIPFDSGNTLVTNNAGSYLLDAYNKTVIARSQYRALTMASGAKITVEGAISIGSKLANQFIGQVGPYGAICMDASSQITVKSGGTLYAWGYIFGSSGKGSVTVESGGTVYEPISIMDYPGSTSLTTTLTDAKVFPMRSYSIRNVEVPMTLNSGAKEYVFSCLYGSNSLVGTNPLYVLLIANGTVNEETPMLQNSGTITKSYANSRMNVSISGDLSLNSLTVQITKGFGSTEISSTQTQGFYIPSCWDMAITSGTTTLNDNVIMCEGSSLTINNDAIVQANSKNIYVLDADDDPNAVGNVAGVGNTIGGTLNGCSIDVADVHGNYYTYVPKDAVLDINGTLIANGGFYTSAAGACITSSQGGGIVEISSASTNVSVNVKATNNYKEVVFNSAQLKNAEGKNPAFTDTSSATTKTTYVYRNGVWCSHTDTNYIDANKDHKCDTCGTVMSQCADATGDGDHACDVCGTIITDHTLENGVCTECGAACEAKIGDVYYWTLTEAISAATAGGTVELLTDVRSSTADKCVIINRNGKTASITLADGLYLCTTDAAYAITKGFALSAAECSYDDEVILRMKFYIPDDYLNGGYTIRLTKDGRWGDVVTTYTMTDLKGAGADSSGRYWAWAGVASGEMTRVVKTEVLDSSENPVTIYRTDGEVLGTAYPYTVKKYVTSALTKANFTDAQKAVAGALAVYGGYAQLYFDVSTDNLASDGIDTTSVGSVTANDIQNTVKYEGADAGIRIKSFEPFLDSATYLRLRFALDAGQSIDNYTFMLTGPGISGNTSLIPDYDATNGRYYVDIPDIPAAYLDNDYTVVVTNKTTQKTHTVNASVIAWVKLAIQNNSNQNQVNMAKALYLYNQAANAYFLNS